MDVTDPLFAAAWRLSIKGMRQALEAGADAAARRPNWPQYAALVVIDPDWRNVWHLDDDEKSQLQAVALRLLGDHGGLSRDIATASLRAALVTDPESGPAVVQALLDAGASMEFETCTALHLVRRVDVAWVLIDAGANPRAVTRRGTPIIHRVLAKYRRNDGKNKLLVVEALISAGADVNALDAAGRTCLVNAAFFDLMAHRKQPVTLPLLLDAGADPTIVSYKGRNLLEDTVRTMQGWMRIDGHSLPADVDEAVDQLPTWIEPWLAVPTFVAHATAWHRRRQILLAVRGRYDDAPTAAGGAGAAAAAGGAAADETGSAAAAV